MGAKLGEVDDGCGCGAVERWWWGRGGPCCWVDFGEVVVCGEARVELVENDRELDLNDSRKLEELVGLGDVAVGVVVVCVELGRRLRQTDAAALSDIDSAYSSSALSFCEGQMREAFRFMSLRNDLEVLILWSFGF